MAAQQAPLSLGFSRQECWSGLPFPSPMHESEVKVKSLSRVGLFATPWTVAYQAPPSMGFFRPEYWSGVPLPSPRCLIDTVNLLHENQNLSTCYIRFFHLTSLHGTTIFIAETQTKSLNFTFYSLLFQGFPWCLRW